MLFEDLDTNNQGEVKALILAGLEERWGSLDPTLNPDLDDMVTSYRDGRTVLLRSAEGLVVGTGTIMPTTNNRAEIVRMSVAASHRRQGLARAILDELIATATRWGVDVIVLETSTSWTSAVEFYKNAGFTITRTEVEGFDPGTWFEYRLDELPYSVP